MLQKISISSTFSQIPDLENPRVVADVNDFQVKFTKLKGDFVWHRHEQEDELFMVIKGRLKMKLRDGDVWVNEGEMILVPHGVEHCPEAPEETHIILFERATTVNTGNVTNDRTKFELEHL